jgi:DtxR family Mn-dependent transcriptional regulator
MQENTTRGLSASLEDYLEAIYQISESKQAARAKDISDRLGVNKSSVTGALKTLAQKELVNYAPYDLITLTPAGKALAERVVRRHQIFFDFLIQVLGVERDEAENNACRAEHALSGTILERIAKFTEFVEQIEGTEDGFAESFQRYCEDNSSSSHACEQARGKKDQSV